MDNVNINKSSILKLSYKSGIKQLSTESYDVIREIIDSKIDELSKIIISINSISPTKTIMEKDVIQSLKILDYEIPKK